MTPDKVSFELLVDSISYKGEPKPSNFEMGAIRNRLASPSARMHMNIHELEQAIRDGLTLMPGICIGGTRLKNWTAQQLFLLDFDNDEAMLTSFGKILEPLDALRRAIDLKLDPLFLYFTAKATAEPWNPRFRLVFALDKPIHDRSGAEHISLSLLNQFPEADGSSGQLNRMFLCPGGEVWPCWTLIY